jgi:hypothetical protein
LDALHVSALEPRCAEVCIVELQTRGAAEGDDAIVVFNQTALDIVAGELKLQYFTASNNLGGTQLLTTTLPSHAALKLTSGSMTPLNSGVVPLNLGLFSKGGSVKIVRANKVVDDIKWGTVELVAHVAGEFYQRTEVGFSVVKPTCDLVRVNEVQPFTVNTNGEDIFPWIELESTSPAATEESCQVEVNSDKLMLTTSTSSYTTFDINQKIETLLFSKDPIPVNDLTPGQTLAFLNGHYEKTWLATRGAQNVIRSTESLDSAPPSCAFIRLSELMINPIGIDKTKEWIELYNESPKPQNLSSCELMIDSKTYGFLDTALSPNEHKSIFQLKNSDDDLVDLVLVNSNVHELALVDATSRVTVQTVQYRDAPEGKSLARSSTGEWKWSDTTSPDSQNDSTAGSDDTPQKVIEVAPIYSGTGEASPVQKVVSSATGLLKVAKSKLTTTTKTPTKPPAGQKTKAAVTSTTPASKASKSPSSSPSKKPFNSAALAEESGQTSNLMVVVLQLCIAVVIAVGIVYTLYGYKNTVIAYLKRRKIDAAAR